MIIHEPNSTKLAKIKMTLRAITGKIKPNLLWFGVYFFTCLLSEGFAAALVFTQFQDVLTGLYVVIAAFFIAVSAVILISLMTECGNDYPNLFLLAIIPLVIGYAIFIMPFAPPDEYTHINRIFDNRMSEIILVPNQLPLEYSWNHNYSDVVRWLSEPFDYYDLRETDFSVSSSSTFCYLIPSLIVDLGRALNINGFLMIYAARIANGTLFILAGFWAIRKIPFGKLFALVFFLNPLLIQQEASCSYDCLTNIGAICFTAQLLYMLKLDKHVFSPKNVAILVAFTLLIAVSKYVYCLLALSALLLLGKVPNMKALVPLCIVSAIAVFTALVIAMNTAIYKEIELEFQTVGFGGFASSLFETISQYSFFHLEQFFGMNLGWPWMHGGGPTTAVRVPLIWLLYMLLFCASIVLSSSKEVFLNKIQRLTLVLVSLITAFVTFIALWMGTTDAVSWYQSRYLLMPAFLGTFAIMPRFTLQKTQAYEPFIPTLFSVLGTLLAFASLCATIVKFWG